MDCTPEVLELLFDFSIDEADEITTITKLIQASNKIIVMVGAGISVSCGIPDFRTPGTGLYDNLSKYNLPKPQSIFSLDYFRENPKPFFALAKELYPGIFKPSDTHKFIKILEDKGKLLRCFTQNIDGLEVSAGVSKDNVVQSHGGFDTYDQCIDCGHEVPSSETKELIFQDQIPKCSQCSGLVKPKIVFFGENLPKRFEERLVDFKEADLLLVMGTSLTVRPFCHQINAVSKYIPRILINRECVGQELPGGDSGFDFKTFESRDIFHASETDIAVQEICKKLAWKIID